MSSLKEQYDLISQAFSESRKKRLWPELLNYLAQLRPGTRVLDMGAGSGRLYQGIPSDVEYIGLDNSPGMLKEARKNYPEAMFVNKNILEHGSLVVLGKFDYIFVIAVAHHLDPQELGKLFISAKRLLNANGIIILSCWRLLNKKFLFAHVRQIFTKIRKLNWRYIEVPWSCSNGKTITKIINRTCYAYDENKIITIAKQAGLQVQKHQKSKANIWLELKDIASNEKIRTQNCRSPAEF